MGAHRVSKGDKCPGLLTSSLHKSWNEHLVLLYICHLAERLKRCASVYTWQRSSCYLQGKRLLVSQKYWILAIFNKKKHSLIINNKISRKISSSDSNLFLGFSFNAGDVLFVGIGEYRRMLSLWIHSPALLHWLELHWAAYAAYFALGK